MFYVGIGEAGTIGIEYWVLESTEKNKRPSAAFLNPSKPIVLSLHGQSHAELSHVLIRKNAALPYLRQRLICHVDCNKLTPAAKRLLFVSNREYARQGQVYSRIEEEIIKALRSDEDLERLNEDARDRDRREHDEEAQKEMQTEVAKLLRLQGMAVETSGGGGPGPGPEPSKRPRPPRPKPTPIATQEPPTYVKILWDEDDPVTFHPDQRRYVRIVTDAGSSYHNAADPSDSRMNFIASGTGVTCVGTTPLTGGRMRAIFQAAAAARIGEKGMIRVELSRPGLPVLSDERKFEIVPPPQPTDPARRRIALPEIVLHPVSPGDEIWEAVLAWPDNPAQVASESALEGGKLTVWYSTAFPNYATQLAALEQQDPALAKSFTIRYTIWLAVHSLLIEKQGEEEATAPAPATIPGSSQGEDPEEVRERLERCRVAALSAMFALREIKEIKESFVVETE